MGKNFKKDGINSDWMPIGLEEAIERRKSRREFDRRRSLSENQLGRLIWASKKVPSAGATYPLELYAVIGEKGVEKEKERKYMESGVYHCGIDRMYLMLEGDLRRELAAACIHQMFIADAPVSLVIAAEYERTTRIYGSRGIRYVYMEAGHASQNIYLQCENLGLATVAIGAFDDESVSSVLGLPKDHKPLYIMPIGFPGRGRL